MLYGKEGILNFHETLASDSVTAADGSGVTFTVNTVNDADVKSGLQSFISVSVPESVSKVFLADVTPSEALSSDVRIKIYVGREYAGKVAVAAHYKNGSWGEKQNLVVDDEGYITPTFSGLSPVAVMITRTQSTSNSSSSSSSGSSSSGSSSSEPRHEHSYEWVLVQEATQFEYGLYQYRCSCGRVETERNFTMMKNIFDQLMNSILSGKAGDTVKLNTYCYYTINKAFAEKFAASGVNLEIEFTYNNENYILRIPAGFDLAQTINEDGYAGYFFIGSFDGVTLEKK